MTFALHVDGPGNLPFSEHGIDALGQMQRHMLRLCRIGGKTRHLIQIGPAAEMQAHCMSKAAEALSEGGANASSQFVISSRTKHCDEIDLNLAAVLCAISMA